MDRKVYVNGSKLFLSTVKVTFKTVSYNMIYSMSLCGLHLNLKDDTIVCLKSGKYINEI